MVQENITVAARIRPYQHTNVNNEQPCLECDLLNSVITAKKKKFPFNKVFNGDATQETIFDNAAQPIIDAFVNGTNGTIFAYGQTGSGKTYTMLGSETNHGIIQKAVKKVFELLDYEKQEKSGNFKYTLKLTCVQIHNEKLYDLLQNNNASLQIQTTTEMINIKGAAEVEVSNIKEFMEQLQKASEQRKTAETLMNHASSRSHGLFMLSLKTETCENGITKTRSSCLNFVDLAGSERQSQTGNTGERLREGGNINKSLTTLSLVIRQINGKEKFISYRDSLLTLILRDSMGGNSKTTVLVTVHSNSQYINETISTLEFAINIKKVKNTTKINEQLTCEEVGLLKTENQNIRQENEKLKSEASDLTQKLTDQIERTKLIEVKLQQKENEIKQLHIDSNAKMEELRTQMAKLQAENIFFKTNFIKLEEILSHDNCVN